MRLLTPVVVVFIFLSSLSLASKDFSTLCVDLVNQNRVSEALSTCQAAIRSDSESYMAHLSYGRALLASDRALESVQHLEKACLLGRTEYLPYFFKGQALFKMERPLDARESFDQATKLAPRGGKGILEIPYPELGFALLSTNELVAAEEMFRKALELNQNNVYALLGMGAVLSLVDAFELAIEYLKDAYKLSPWNPYVSTHLAAALQYANRTEESLFYFQKTLELEPTNADYINNVGIAYEQLGDIPNTIHYLSRAWEIRHELPETPPFTLTYHFLNYNNQANRPKLTRPSQEGEEKPKLPLESKDIGSEVRPEAYTQSDSLDWSRSDNLNRDAMMSRWALGRMRLWNDNIEEAMDPLRRHLGFEHGDLRRRPPLPRTLPSEHSSLRGRRRWLWSEHAPKWCSKAFSTPGGVGDKGEVAPGSYSGGSTVVQGDCRTGRRGDVIHIGYISYEYRSHATCHLFRDMFALHDRDKFFITAYAYGFDDGSFCREAVEKGSDRFVNLAGETEEVAARRIHSDGVDILVEMTGNIYRKFTAHNASTWSLNVAALRPAPVQIHYLSDPSSIGASFLSYQIVDRVIVPPEEVPYYRENIAYLPYVYQFDSPREAEGIGSAIVGPCTEEWTSKMTHTATCGGKRTKTRFVEGVPEDVFVFSAFTQQYKIEPEIFTVWMNILRRVPYSIIWLFPTKEDFIRLRLRQEAAARGIDPDRLVFARYGSPHDHVSRIGIAHLGLDTLTYNGHTTTSDSLWSGTPVISCPGKYFASRVASSILIGAGMEELVVNNLDQYEELAVFLATNPGVLENIRMRLSARLNLYPLYNTQLQTLGLESLYAQIWNDALEKQDHDKRAAQQKEFVRNLSAGEDMGSTGKRSKRILSAGVDTVSEGWTYM